MVPDRFSDQANSIQDANTGEYVDDKGVSIIVHVHEAFSLEQLTKIYRDNIRWVAADYKAQLCSEEGQFYVIKNCMRDKRMNLAADIAQWASVGALYPNQRGHHSVPGDAAAIHSPDLHQCTGYCCTYAMP